ncbi:hypothetical protein [Desulfovibrio desulfuricans]|uniref:hypothetical protein n=1 Tax=Desulfovibrio desulfuricans TaxID=876 RepID=UPI001AE86439|nr:hypothetical protein [Desulfovibrio desulfuricans]QTO41259.1 hypothetical protein J8J02_04990 [Desulfovibrio desulfuricans]
MLPFKLKVGKYIALWGREYSLSRKKVTLILLQIHPKILVKTRYGPATLAIRTRTFGVYGKSHDNLNGFNAPGGKGTG